MIPQSSRIDGNGMATISLSMFRMPSSLGRTPPMQLLCLGLLLTCCCSCHAFTVRTTKATSILRVLPIITNQQRSNKIPLRRTLLSSTNRNQQDDSLVNADDDDDVYVMVNGMPGPMATAAAEACLRKGLQLSPIAMTGPNVESSTITVVDPITQRNANVRLIPSTDTAEVIASLAGIRAALGSSNIYAIDYTHPLAVNSNCKFYIQQNVPFVMGTTGGNRTELYHDVETLHHDTDTNEIHPNFSCVIAPNMGKQIVAMQAALSDLATKYPGAFAGYQLQVTESHQKTKADTSGTAKAVIDSIQRLTADTKYTYEDIQMIRNDQESIQFGIPEKVIQENTGHAYHTYTLTSPDSTVQFQLQHNVIGRTIYAEGTADAVKFLANQVRKQARLLLEDQGKDTENSVTATITHPRRRVYDMIDVLKEGALE